MDPRDPAIHERGVACLVDPVRPGSATALVNLVTRHVGMDAASWSFGRLASMAAQLHAEAREG